MIVAAVLALAVVIGWIRLVLRHRRVRMAGGRLAALLALQPIVALLLYCALLPPGGGRATTTLVVATAGAPRLVARRAGEELVALPEAPTMPGVASAPDLGTALRRHPEARSVRMIGSGLDPRDRAVAASVSLAFDPSPAPTGLVALDPPGITAPGAAFAIAARVVGVAGATVELVDPANRVVDVRKPDATGSVVLSGTVRVPGSAAFALRVRVGEAIVEQAVVPVVTPSPVTARLMIAAAAPGPEVKALRRWAVDAGLTPATDVAIGGGAAFADGSTTPAQADAAIIDDRTWVAMNAGRRAALGAAVRDGLGVVVRLTGPVSRGWTVLGLGVGSDGDTAPVTLPTSAPSDTALAARRGPGTADIPAAMAGSRDDVPALTRQAVTFGADAVPILRDARGTTIAAWHPVGRGRVALVALQDSFALVTSGHRDRHAELWSDIVSAVARARTGTSPATLDSVPQAGRRMAICDADDATVMAPGGDETRLLVDPGTGRRCAGYWPIQSGWHRLSSPAARPFYVHPSYAVPALREAERREATLRLVGDRPAAIDAIRPQPKHRGSAWPWFLGWLAAATLLWWLERTRSPDWGRYSVRSYS